MVKSADAGDSSCGLRSKVFHLLLILAGGLGLAILLFSQSREAASILDELRALSERLYSFVVMALVAASIVGSAYYWVQWERRKRLEKRASECDELEEEKKQVTQERDRLREENADLEDKLQKADRRLAAVENCDGHWLRPVLRAPPFVTTDKRSELSSKTRFVSFINFKGGVGKTALAANLGHIYAAQRNKRVLFVDLDFQGSLSRLCVDGETLTNTEKGQLTSDALLTYDRNSPTQLTSLLKTLTKPYAHYDGNRNHAIVAREELAPIEFMQEARWLVRSAEGIEDYDIDERFRLRQALHIPYVFHNYDYVFFDCPPRQTVSSINAIACSDYVVIPVQADQNAGESLPRTIWWLNTIMAHLNSHGRIAGVVANMTKIRSGELDGNSNDNYTAISELLRGENTGVELFTNTVKFDTDVSRASMVRQPVACWNNSTFDAIAGEFEEDYLT